MLSGSGGASVLERIDALIQRAFVLGRAGRAVAVVRRARLAQGSRGTLWERDLRPLWLDAGIPDKVEERFRRHGRGLYYLGQKVDLRGRA